ncbi:histidine kinase N-terminal 7TM domain-containing protein [Halovenus salina]|uniref:histidine kinase n=1 Tax=Halovenus salina TaxID=1510225 RepID=A0ABD5W267_9EURY|nr:histidine kinase N-terminal 7TM domain-containing protein [Halovenus salina]
MTQGAQSMAFLMFMSTVPIIGVAAYAVRTLEKPGARGLLFCLLGMVGWSFALIIVTWPTRVFPVHVTLTGRFLSQILVAFGWPLFAWEYLRRERVSIRPAVLVVFSVIPVVTLVLSITNPLHHLVVLPETPTNPTGISELVLGPWYLVHICFAIAFAMLPVGLLLSDFWGAHGTHRRQLLLMFAGWIVGFPGALQTHLFRNIEAIPLYVDLTPVTFLITALLWGVALYQYQLFSLVPVSRRTAVETMPDPIVSIDQSGQVVDANAAANRLFGTEETPMGVPFEEFCKDQPEVLSLYESNVERQPELALETDGETHYFVFERRSISPGSSKAGSLLVFRDVTELREREQDLDLLRQVQSRILRHNIRNDLGAVQAYSELLVDEVDGKEKERVEEIRSITDDLVALSNKTRTVETFVKQDQTSGPIDLGEVVHSQCTRYSQQYPDVTVTVDVPEEYWVVTIPAMRAAFENLIENAFVHSDTDDATVEVSLVDGEEYATVVITNNGTEIPAQELAVLEKQEETQLQHGSGIGLWLVNWVIRNSDMRVEFETEAGATSVTVEIPAETDEPT